MVLLLASLAVVGLASAAGSGTFSIEQTKSADVGQIGVATLYMDNTWQPAADDVWVTVNWDGAVLGYISTDWKVGNSVSATLNGTNSLFMQMADFTNKYGNGKVAIADINFKALTAGSSPMTVQIDHVRSHEGTSSNFTDLTPSAIANQGTFTVAPGTLTPTVTTIVPTGNVTTAVPTGNVTTAVPTGNVTTGVPTVAPTGVPVGNPKAILKPGDTVFIGEYGLDLSALGVADGTTLGWFQAGSNVRDELA